MSVEVISSGSNWPIFSIKSLINLASGLSLDQHGCDAKVKCKGTPFPRRRNSTNSIPIEAISRIETVVENNTQLCFAVDGDARSWGEMAVARVKARVKAKTKTVT
jgi:hypothetical protein